MNLTGLIGNLQNLFSKKTPFTLVKLVSIVRLFETTHNFFPQIETVVVSNAPDSC